MKAGTARKVLCNDKTADSVAKARGKTAQSVKNEAKSLLRRLHKRGRNAKK